MIMGSVFFFEGGDRGEHVSFGFLISLAEDRVGLRWRVPALLRWKTQQKKSPTKKVFHLFIFLLVGAYCGWRFIPIKTLHLFTTLSLCIYSKSAVDKVRWWKDPYSHLRTHVD
jgi:hypothetical protein